MSKPDGRSLAYLALNSRKRSQHLSDTLDSLFRTHNVDQRERSLALELSCGVLRWQERLDWFLESLSKGCRRNTKPSLKTILRLGAYQILFLDRIPDYAVVNASVALAKERFGAKSGGFVNAILRKIVCQGSQLEKTLPGRGSLRGLSVMFSHPLWMVKRWASAYGREQTEALLEWNNSRPGVHLRARRGFGKKVANELVESGTELVDAKGPYFHVRHSGDLSALNCIRTGGAYVQNPASGLVCDLACATPGEWVLDLCSAPGGKTRNLMDSVQQKDRGRFVAADLSHMRLAKLGKEKHGPGLVVMDGLSPALLKHSFDLVLVDAPCSNTGVLGKRPEARWDRKAKDIGRLAELQLALLCSAAELTKPGGRIVYSTCSLEKEENEEVVEGFLKLQSSFELVGANLFVDNEFADADGFLRVLPFKHRLDGMFGARLEKVG